MCSKCSQWDFGLNINLIGLKRVLLCITCDICTLCSYVTVVCLQDKVSSAVKSEARMPAVFRAHHNARILCVMEHPTLKMRQNASILLDVQCKFNIIIEICILHIIFKYQIIHFKNYQNFAHEYCQVQ